MRGFNHATILNSPTFHGLRRERLAQWRPICIQTTTEKTKGGGGGGYFQKNWGGGCGTLPEPLPYLRPKSVIFLPYFRPDHEFDILFQTWNPGARCVTSCHGTYTVGLNINMALSANDEEVASSKKHTKFKTRVHKPYPVKTNMVEIDTLFQTKRAKKLSPLAPHIPI